jgi:hypothetical protein
MHLIGFERAYVRNDRNRAAQGHFESARNAAGG